MRSNAAHIYVISPESVSVRDCVFEGGDQGSEGMMDGPCLRLCIDFCIFSSCRNNCAVYANNQATVVISNSTVRDCGHSGLRAEEGSSLTVLNCDIVRCSLSCL